jgi:hypothetical protein
MYYNKTVTVIMKLLYIHCKMRQTGNYDNGTGDQG